MSISDLSINRPITTLMVVLLILLLGLVSLSRLNIALFPNMAFPVAAVITNYEGVGPMEIENIVTKPLEGVLGTVANLKQISSISRAGHSIIILEFNWGTNMDFTTLEMREKIDLIKGMLPDGVSSPAVFKFDPSIMPIAQFGVSGEQDLVKLKSLLEGELIPRLERIEGVASVGLQGGLKREIRIEADQYKLAQHGIDLQTISGLLRLENLNLPSGRIRDDETEYILRTTGEFKNIEEIGELIIPGKQGMIRLKEIAQIRDTYQEIRQMARMDGEPSVGIAIQKQTDANTVRVSREIFTEITKIEQENPGLKITPIIDQAQYIEDSITNVGKSALLGGSLAILILYLFLRNVRSTLIIGAAIPISIIATFVLIYFGGLTLNLMTLGGLALGIGMLVDNSIVVLENIFRYRQSGQDRIESAKKGSSEVRGAIIASTLTSIIVFLPVIFVEGIASQLFNELALTVTFSLLASLGVALTFIPMIAAQILNSNRLRKVHNAGRLLQNLIKIYQRALSTAIKHPWIVLGVTIVFVLIGLKLIPSVGAEFIPTFDQGEIQISVQLPIGTVPAKTEEVINQIEAKVRTLKEVESVFVSIGSGNQAMITGGAEPEVGELLIRLVPLEKRKKTTAQVIEELRKMLRDFRDAEIEIKNQSMISDGGMMSAPISIQVLGPDLSTLKNIAEDIVGQIKEVKGVREVEYSLEEGRPELQIIVDRAQAAKYGLQTVRVASAVRGAIQGEIPSRFRSDGKEYDLRIQLRWEDRKNLESLENLLIQTPLGIQVPLKSLAELKTTTGPAVIERKNGSRMIEVNGDLYNRDLASATQEIKQLINDNIILPDQYSVKIGGQYEEMSTAFSDLGFALILAVVLVYMVLAAQFESLLYPFIILLTVPLALVGAIFGLYLTGFAISVISIIGVIMLSGIVVNNAIVLVDHINTLRADGKKRADAILLAGPIRLRPILMTSLTTILGLVPLILGLGEGSEVQAPLAVVVIGGLSFATFLTLLFVPAIYILLDNLGERFSRVYKKLQTE